MAYDSHNWPAYLPEGKILGRGIVGVPGTLRPDNATQSPGSSNSPGSTGREAPARIRVRILDLVFENWMPFTAWLMSRFIGPRPSPLPWESPDDLDAGERITRFGSFPSAIRPFPYPYMVGAVSGFMPVLDQYSMQWAWGKTPSGPGVSTPIPIPWDTTYPTLPKVSG